MRITTLLTIIAVVTECHNATIAEGVLRCLCPPGQFVKEPCERNKAAVCNNCSHGLFNNKTNTARFCANCSHECARHRQIIYEQCTPTRDIICACEEGYFYSREHDRCMIHSTCPVGQGVNIPGTPFEDTQCKTCITGYTFSNTDSSIDGCLLCTNCSGFNRIDKACSLTHDAICQKGEGIPTDGITAHGKSSTPATTTPKASDGNNGTDTVYIVLVVLAVAVAVVAVGVICLVFLIRCCMKQRRDTNRKSSEDEEDNELIEQSSKIEELNGVITFLSENMAGNFENFYLHLLGTTAWCNGQNKTAHDQARMAKYNIDIPSYIRLAMNTWVEKNKTFASKETILKTLRATEELDLARRLNEYLARRLNEYKQSSQNGMGIRP